MITLHQAIRNVQDELIKSEQERRQRGIPPLFVTEKLTIELSCVFTETDSTDKKGGINALSVLALDAASANSVSSEEVQKVILEFKMAESNDTVTTKETESIEDSDAHSILPSKICGMYPYRNN